MIGDSITDTGRTQPVGEGLFNAHGSGYVALVNALLTSTYPAHKIRVVNMGTSGHTVRELKSRWQSDVVDQKPDWVSILIGINDVWRQFDSPLQPEWHVLPDEYEGTLDELVALTKPLVKGLVLMTPYYVEPLKEDAMRKQMDRYGDIVRKIASKHHTLLADTQAAFDTMLQTYHPTMLSWDRVHPGQPGAYGQVGHMVIAKAFVDSVGFDWHP